MRKVVQKVIYSQTFSDGTGWHMSVYEVLIRKVTHNGIRREFSMTERCQLWDADGKTSYGTKFSEIFDEFC